MFTGLVEAVGELVERAPTPAGARLRIRTPLANELAVGDSVAVNGVCLTATSVNGGEMHADIGPETLRVTTLGVLERGALVNLERPLRADARFGGHFVSGHVDAMGRVEERRADDEFVWLTVSFPIELAPFFIPKGSIAVDGISLTIARLGRDRFEVMLIPHTIENTNVRRVKAGDAVNLECDLVGKYVVRAAEIAGSVVPRAASETR